MVDPWVFLSVGGEGSILPLSEAKIPVLDRGFIFGDGVYEVVPIYGGAPFRLEHHLARFSRSLGKLSIANPFTDEEWVAKINEVVARSSEADQFVYMQVTRGVAKRGHAFPAGTIPTIFMMSSPLVLPAAEARANGVAVVTATDNRWLRCDIKAISLLGNVLMAQHAAEEGVTETIMFRNGNLTEGSSSNVWIVKNGVILAVPRDEKILEGIRYGLLHELADAHGIPFEIRDVTEAEVRAADEIMLSSATKEVLPVTRIDGKPVGNGKPGPIYATLYAAYQTAIAAAKRAPAAVV